MRVHILSCEGTLPQINQLLLSKLGVVVNVDLGVDAVDFVLRVYSPGVDLDLCSVSLVEHPVKVLHLLPVALDVL